MANGESKKYTSYLFRLLITEYKQMSTTYLEKFQIRIKIAMLAEQLPSKVHVL